MISSRLGFLAGLVACEFDINELPPGPKLVGRMDIEKRQRERERENSLSESSRDFGINKIKPAKETDDLSRPSLLSLFFVPCILISRTRFGQKRTKTKKKKKKETLHLFRAGDTRLLALFKKK
jgi:hypothetical protein